MSSGSKQLAVGVAVFAASIVWFAAAVVRGGSTPARGWPEPTHLIVPTGDVPTAPASAHVLRVCSDPNNMPFSDRDGRGFENRVAELVARDLGKRLEYFWQPQRRGFIRTALNAGRCDVVMGMPARSEMVRVTRPYYRSSYVFVWRRDRGLGITSFDDPRLRRLRIGIPMTGDDYENPPAEQALAARRIFDNVRGYMVYGDYSTQHPAWGPVDAVARREVDVSIVWGPLAGYAARHESVPLQLAPVSDPSRGALQFAFDISIGVRRRDAGLAAAIDGVLARRAGSVHRILAAYAVPLVESQEEVQR